MEEKIILSGLTPAELCQELNLDKAFRGKQLFSWISKGGTNFETLTTFDKATRERLAQTAQVYSSTVTQVLKDKDGTIKLQITLYDNRAVETVLLTDKEGRKTACVSSQAGCGMHCAFCQTGQLGLGRNLEPHEIVEEFLFLEKEAGILSNIVFMGMGEPLQNISAIKKAIDILSSKEGRNLSTRRITVSTCGLVKGIYHLADNGPAVRLAVSLTTANADLRKALMPVAHHNSLEDLKKALLYYTQKTGQRVTLEAALFSGINTTAQSAKELRDFAAGLDVFINLIPWNPVEGLDFKTPSKEECNTFLKHLSAMGLNASLRTRRGTTIGGACGQLGKVSTTTTQAPLPSFA